MKKPFVAFFLVLIMCCAFAGCTDTSEQTPSDGNGAVQVTISLE